LVLNRVDLDFVAAATDRVAAFAKRRKLRFFPISAATGQGVEKLLKHLGEAITRERVKAARTP